MPGEDQGQFGRDPGLPDPVPDLVAGKCTHRRGVGTR